MKTLNKSISKRDAALLNLHQKLSVLFLVTISILASCTVQKRHFRPGYYVQWNSNNHNLEKAKETQNEVKLNANNKSNIDSDYSISIHDTDKYDYQALAVTNLNVTDTNELTDVYVSEIINDSIVAKSNVNKLNERKSKIHTNNKITRNRKNNDNVDIVQFDSDFSDLDIYKTKRNKQLFSSLNFSATKVLNNEPGDIPFLGDFFELIYGLGILLLIIIILSAFIMSIIEFGLVITLFRILSLCITLALIWLLASIYDSIRDWINDLRTKRRERKKRQSYQQYK